MVAVLAAVAVFVLPGPVGDTGPAAVPDLTTTSPADVLNRLADTAAAQPPPAPGRYDYVRSEHVELHGVGPVGEVEQDVLLRYETRTWRGDDGSARTEQRGHDQATRDIYGDRGEIYGPGEYRAPRTVLPTDPGELQALLIARGGGEYSAGAVISGFHDDSVQVNEPEANAAVLRVLAGMPGLRVERAVDLAGREGVAVVAEEPSTDTGGLLFERALIVDPATGGLLGAETRLIGGGGADGLPPQVVARTTWVEVTRVDELGELP